MAEIRRESEKQRSDDYHQDITIENDPIIKVEGKSDHTFNKEASKRLEMLWKLRTRFRRNRPLINTKYFSRRSILYSILGFSRRYSGRYCVKYREFTNK